MLLKGTSYQLNTIGAKEPGEEVWFILNGEGFRVKVWFPSWSAQMQIHVPESCPAQ